MLVRIPADPLHFWTHALVHVIVWMGGTWHCVWQSYAVSARNCSTRIQSEWAKRLLECTVGTNVGTMSETYATESVCNLKIRPACLGCIRVYRKGGAPVRIELLDAWLLEVSATEGNWCSIARRTAGCQFNDRMVEFCDSYDTVRCLCTLANSRNWVRIIFLVF